MWKKILDEAELLQKHFVEFKIMTQFLRALVTEQRFIMDYIG